jgi:hypothetical protein
MNRIQSVERLNDQLARLWHQNSGMRVVLYSSIPLKRAQAINSEYYIALLELLNRRNQEKTAPFKEEKSAVSSRQCTGSQFNQTDGKIA